MSDYPSITSQNDPDREKDERIRRRIEEEQRERERREQKEREHRKREEGESTGIA